MPTNKVEKIGRLTGREQQVATLVCNGLPNKMVARKLNVSEGTSTIKIHLHKIFQKLGCKADPN